MKVMSMYPFVAPLYFSPKTPAGTPSGDRYVDASVASGNTAASAKLTSAKGGILKHGEHLVDMVLDIAPGAETGALPGFERYEGFVRRLMADIEAKEIALLNEKFDGSPSIVLGFDANNRPYVAYKHGVEAARGPRIVRTAKEAKTIYTGSAMRQIFEDCIRYLRPRMRRFGARDLVFQADLMFTPRNGARSMIDGSVVIRANPFGIAYTIPPESRFHEFAAHAKVGLVVHTVGRLLIDEKTGEVAGIAPLGDPQAVEEFVKTLRSRDVFAIDPWSRRVQIDRGADTFTAEKCLLIERILTDMRGRLAGLGADFRMSWKTMLPQFRTFLNASLKAGHGGGIYRAAARDAAFDFDLLAARFHEWLVKRSQTMTISPKGTKSTLAPKRMPQSFEAMFENHRDAMQAYFSAYFDAIRVQYLLKPHMQEVYRSKLGGTAIEGIMMSDDATTVKLVDRLEFTMLNFAGERERTARRNAKPAAARRTRTKAAMPQLYRKWRAGAAFFLGKLQPPHAGHIAMLGAAAAYFGAQNVFLMPSDKAPNLSAENWRDLGAADRKSDLKAGNFTHVFSPALREEILRFGLPDGVTVRFANTATFWRYLNRAKERGRQGNVALIMGEKEIEDGRYRAQIDRFAGLVRPWPVAMQREGLSATSVRGAIRMLHDEGDLFSYEFLVQALNFVGPAKERDRIIGMLVREWGRVAAAAARLL